MKSTSICDGQTAKAISAETLLSGLAAKVQPNTLLGDYAIMNEDNKRQVSASLGLLTYFGILAASLLLSLVFINGSASVPFQFLLLLALLLPSGLAFLSGLPPGPLKGFICLISYASFIFFLVAFIRTRTWGRYAILCFAFIFLIVLNLAGCRQSGFHGPE